MAAINKASTQTAVANNLVLAAKLTERHQTVVDQTVWKIPMKKGVNQIDLPTYGTVSVSALTDGTDLSSNSAFTPTVATFTASERGALIVVTDKAMRENQEQVTKLAGRELGRAWAEDVDTQLITNFDNFATSLGGATTEITPKYALAAMGFLQGNSTARIPMDGDVFGVLHPYQGYELQSALSLPGTSNVPLDLQSKLISRMFVASLFGARLFISGLITVSSDAAKGAIYHRQAIVKVEQLGMRIEEERDATLRATEYVLCGDWGHGEYKDTWGVEMFFYAQTPSGTTI